MGITEIKPIRQIAKTGDNWAGRGSTDGTYLYIPTVTAGIATLSKYDTQGTLIWERNLSNSSAGSTSSAAPDGSILVASSSGGSAGKTSALARFNSTGDKLWEITNADPTHADVAISGSTVYVSGGTGTGFNSANTAFINAYSLDNGTLLWSKKYPNSGAASIGDLEIVDGNIYVAASLYGKQDFDIGIAGKLDLNGNEIWWKSAPANDWNAVWSVRVVGDQLLGVGYKGDGGDRGDTRLISFNKDNGTILWDKSWGDNNQQGSGNIEILNGKVYVSYGDGVAWNSSAVSGGYSVVDELDTSGNLINTYKFDLPSANDGAGSLIKVGNSLYMLGSTNETIQGQSNGGGYDVYIASVVVAPKPTIRGNSLYTIVDGPSWTQAEANSVKLGGHLVTVNDVKENGWIASEFSSEKYFYDGDSANPIHTHFWLGGTDHGKEGIWSWTSGQDFSFDYFDRNHPAMPIPNNQGAGGSDYLMGIFNVTSDYLTGGGLIHGNGIGSYYWDDSANSYPGFNGRGITETPFIRRGDSAYVIVQGPTWEEAEANAVKLGGHLVTINDAAENDWIVDNLDFAQAWIGLEFDLENNEWNWASRDNSQFRYWNEGEPNGNNAEWEDFYGVIRKQWSGYWNDAGDHHAEEVVYGIAEIKLAPNNPLSGTPTLSGTFKAGQVITIDRTPIQDTDNFTGYTPDFKYSWELSTNGTTWTKLTTTDATDNNSTYTLTTAEVGKKIRGVVSYLDGYGTNESVASTESSVIQAAINLDIGSTSTTASKTTTLASTISRLTLTGTSNINGTGNALNNYLTGNNGNNILDGGVGNDILAGGRGNDTYIVDSIYDSIIENLNEGIEIVQSSVNWTLGANLENLTLTGSGNLSGTGNELNNTIIGNSGNNVLDGGSGIDTLDGGSGNDTLIGGLGNDVMKGGAGNDTYYVDSTGDTITDTIGTDTVVSSISWTLGSNLENLTLTGIDALTGIGNNDKNSIVGNSGNNVLDGLAGTDFLTGGAGADVFRFSTKPSFGASSADHITDFKASEGDGLEISASLLGLTMGPTVRIGLSVTTVSNASALTTALGSTTTFVYDSSNGNLYWNQNGNRSGFGSGGIFAVLDNKSALTSSNISLF